MIGKDEQVSNFRFQRLSFAAITIGALWGLRFLAVQMLVSSFDTVNVGGPIISVTQIILAIFFAGEILILFAILLYIYRETVTLMDYSGREGHRKMSQNAADKAYLRLFVVTRTVLYTALFLIYAWIVWSDWGRPVWDLSFWVELGLLAIPIGVLFVVWRNLQSFCKGDRERLASVGLGQRCRGYVSKIKEEL